jgi:PEP-CTERM motif
MKKRLLTGLLGGALMAPAAANATVINFHAANQGFPFYGGYSVLYYGQGAASDSGNNVWNGFGMYTYNGGGPGSTTFYGGSNPDSGHGSVPNGNPGNPYAWWAGNTSVGTNLFSPTNSGAANVGNANSDGTISPVTLSVSYDGDNGSTNGVTQGSPSFLLGNAAIVTNNDVGTFSLMNVPAGTYDLYLYGTNYDGTRGAAFTASSGSALDGITSAIGPNAASGSGPLNSYVLGQDYVEFVGVVPDSNGTISGTWTGVTNPQDTSLTGEGDFNGLQLVSASAVPEPASLAVIGLGALGLLSRRRRNA